MATKYRHGRISGFQLGLIENRPQTGSLSGPDHSQKFSCGSVSLTGKLTYSSRRGGKIFRLVRLGLRARAVQMCPNPEEQLSFFCGQAGIRILSTTNQCLCLRTQRIADSTTIPRGTYSIESSLQKAARLGGSPSRTQPLLEVQKNFPALARLKTNVLSRVSI